MINTTHFGLFSLASTISISFQTVRRMREAWLFDLSLFRPSQQSNIPTSVPRRAKKDSKFPLPVEQDRSSALPQGRERAAKSPPHDLRPPPLPLPRRLYIDKCISGIRIPCVVFRIPKQMIQESASKNFTDSGIQHLRRPRGR